MKYNITPKEVFELLSSNKEILNRYKKIELREKQGNDRAYHNIEHINNVSKVAEKILKDLNFEEDTIYKCKIACLLHDVGALDGKEEHAIRSFEYAKNFFEENNLEFEDKEIVLDAIKNHSNGFDKDNIILLAIILADKLDIKESRITEEGKKVEGNRQYAHIKDIVVEIKDDNLTINFITDGKMNKKEANEYYFTSKVFKAIEAFSNKLNLDYSILMDGIPWKL